jgi:hypothetical protein
MTVCEVCQWQSEPSEISSHDSKFQDEQPQEKPEGDCVFVEVPLRGANPLCLAKSEVNNVFNIYI